VGDIVRRMNTRRNLVLLAVGIIVLLGAAVIVIRASGGDSGDDLEGDWTVELLVIDGEEMPVVAGTTPTATFAGGDVQGSAGCNTFSGGYEIDGESLTMGPFASTRMFCEEPSGAMDQEAAYLGLLGEAESFTVDGDVLAIRAGDGRKIEFTRS
jgi:heat shock protein HslJ